MRMNPRPPRRRCCTSPPMHTNLTTPVALAGTIMLHMATAFKACPTAFTRVRPQLRPLINWCSTAAPAVAALPQTAPTRPNLEALRVKAITGATPSTTGHRIRRRGRADAESRKGTSVGRMAQGGPIYIS